MANNVLTPEDRKRAMMTALMTAGLGAMAASGRGRGVAANIGAGGLAGLGAYQQSITGQRQLARETLKREAYGQAAQALAPRYPAAAKLIEAGEAPAARTLIEAQRPRKGTKFTKADRIMVLARKLAEGKATDVEKDEYYYLINADPIERMRRDILDEMRKRDPAKLR